MLLAAVSVLALARGMHYWWNAIEPYSELQALSEKYDPSAMQLKSDVEGYIEFAVTSERVQVGKINLENRSSIKFWFLSDHVNHGKSLAIFEFPDGTRAKMDGYFCCGVDFVGDKPRSVSDLRRFIQTHKGAPV
jgi:hypothetical protein